MTEATIGSAVMRQEPTILQLAAMDVFADKGLEKTTFEDVALSAGVSADDIRSEYKTPKDLFLSLVPLAASQEFLFASWFLRASDERTIDTLLYEYLESMPDRCNDVSSMRFLIYAKHCPKKELTASVASELAAHRERLIGVVEATYKRAEGTLLPPEVFAEVYLSLADSLEIDLLHDDLYRFSGRLAGIGSFFEIVFDSGATQV